MSCFTQVCNNFNCITDSNFLSSCNIHLSPVQLNKNEKLVCVSSSDIWHRKLGHPSVNGLKQVLSHVNDNSCAIKSLSFFSAYKFAKMHQEHFPSSQTKTFKPFELSHSDVWGPSHALSMDGSRYYIHFIDDFTRFTWIFPLKLKSDYFKVFVQFNAFIERQFNSKIYCLQTYWGGEFKSFLPLLSSLGIQLRHPYPYVHQQNGRAEQKHQHIVELGLTLLAQAQLPFK